MTKKFIAFLICLPLLTIMCTKQSPSNDNDGPDVVLHTSGYLCTMGKNGFNHQDTLTFWFSASGQDMSVFGREYLRPEDEISLTVNSNNTMTIKKRIPYVQQNKPFQWLGIRANANPDFSSFPDNEYLFTLFHETESELTQFHIKRSQGDMNKFTIESKAYPGYYLGVAKWEDATYPTEDRLVFTTIAKEFWFEQR